MRPLARSGMTWLAVLLVVAAFFVLRWVTAAGVFTSVPKIAPNICQPIARLQGPEDFEVEEAPVEAIRGGSPTENAGMIRAIFEGEGGARRDVVVMNAAAALVAAGVAENFADGARLARAAIDSGAAREKLAALVEFTTTTYEREHRG